MMILVRRSAHFVVKSDHTREPLESLKLSAINAVHWMGPRNASYELLYRIFRAENITKHCTSNIEIRPSMPSCHP